MLAGRTLFGGLFFSGLAAINLRCPRVGGRPITNTMDAARVLLRAAVGADGAVHGHFVYDLDGENKIKGQTDYWDDRPQAR